MKINTESKYSIGDIIKYSFNNNMYYGEIASIEITIKDKDERSIIYYMKDDIEPVREDEVLCKMVVG